MKQYIKTFIYGAILSIILLVLSILFWIINSNSWFSSFFMGGFSSAIFVAVFALISYLIDRKNSVNDLKAFILFLESQYEILKIYKQKYKSSKIQSIVYQIYNWHNEITEKRNKKLSNFYSFNFKLNKELTLLNSKLDELYIWLIRFTENNEEESIFAWFLFLEEELNIEQNIKNIKSYLNLNITNYQNECISHFKNKIIDLKKEIINTQKEITKMHEKENNDQP